jgi:predicted NAD/FAD-binding protein
MRVAIVGAGVSGLTAAHLLHGRHEVTVLEREARPGGHSNTVQLEESGRSVGVDTGFIVYNEQTYPLFTRLLARLGVATQPSEMSFGVTCERCRLTYSGRSLAGLFAQPRRLADPRFLRLLADIVRFNRWANARRLGTVAPGATLGDARAEARCSRFFWRHYLVPMTAAIWSATAATAEAFPLALFLEFFHNHGLLQLRNQPAWRTVSGGSRQYVVRLARPLGERLRLSSPVRSVCRLPDAVDVQLEDGSRSRFDAVVLATHSDQALALLSDPSPAETAALSAIPYTPNTAVLHTDDRLLPAARAARASWNYHMADCRTPEAPLSLTYYMNRLQKLDAAASYCVTLNDEGRVEPARVIARLRYHHPVYSVEGIQARRALRALSGDRRTFYCGAYLGSGFHEDGVRAGDEVARALGALGLS